MTRSEAIRELNNAAKEGKLGALDQYGSCVYRSEVTGKLCVIGYMMKDAFLDSKDSIAALLESPNYNYRQEDVLLPEYAYLFSDEELEAMQELHDSWALLGLEEDCIDFGKCLHND